MAVITAKVISAITKEGMAIIVIEFDDGAGKWQKTYKQSTETIRAADFKAMVAADIRRNLKVKIQLLELTPLVGKTFTFTV